MYGQHVRFDVLAGTKDIFKKGVTKIAGHRKGQKLLKEDIIRKIQMENKLKKGIDNGEFRLYYQPQLRLNTEEIIGMEALTRWIHPDEGFISPAVFIPAAEETDQIYILEQWVLHKALRQKREWEEEGFGHIELSINLSGRTLESRSAFQEIEEIFSEHKVDYSKIVIEMTETALFSNMELVIEHLERLKERGIKIALDDFGTGYSSLTHLKKLPIDIIKLDKSFVGQAPEGGKETVIIKNIISMAHELEYRVIAEGIETYEQLDCLKKFTCETGQGFLFERPMPKDIIRELLRFPNRKETARLKKSAASQIPIMD